MKSIILGLAAMLPLAAAAEDVSVSGNVTLTSDYSFRGVSQTTRDPAIQGGFDVEFDNGFYIGTWGSNVNFGDDASMELDLYVGYGGTFPNSEVSYDLTYIRYEYPSEGDSLDYNEIGASIGFGDLTVGLMYSNEYFGEDGPDWFYPYVEYSLGLSNDMTLDLHIGYNDADEDDFFGDDDNYIDYSATLTIPVSGVDLGIAIVGTNIDDDFCDEECEARAIVSISKSL